MWVFAAIAFISIGGVTCINEDCGQEIHNDCERLMPSELPATTEELDHFCSEIKSYMKCVYDVGKECEDNEEYIEFMKLRVDFLEKTCQSDSDIYKVISSNFECLDSAIKTDVPECYYIDNVHQDIVEVISELFASRSDESGEQSTCIAGLLTESCTAAVVHKKCGRKKEVTDAVLDILHNVDPKLQFCGEEVHADMEHIMSAFMGIEDAEEVSGMQYTTPGIVDIEDFEEVAGINSLISALRR